MRDKDWPFQWEGNIERRMNIELHSLSRGIPMGLDDGAIDELLKTKHINCTRVRLPNQSGRYGLTSLGTERRDETTDGCTVGHCPCKAVLKNKVKKLIVSAYTEKEWIIFPDEFFSEIGGVTSALESLVKEGFLKSKNRFDSSAGRVLWDGDVGEEPPAWGLKELAQISDASEYSEAECFHYYLLLNVKPSPTAPAEVPQ